MVTSAGLLVWRRDGERVELLLGHPGGPFYARKDKGSWSAPKGQVDPGEGLLAAARREFVEETGLQPPDGEPVPLGEVRQRTGKVVVLFAVEGEVDVAGFDPGEFEMTWPPGSGQRRSFPEIDRLEWVDLEEAADWLTASQRPFVARMRPVAGGAAGAAG